MGIASFSGAAHGRLSEWAESPEGRLNRRNGLHDRPDLFMENQIGVDVLVCWFTVDNGEFGAAAFGLNRKPGRRKHDER